MTKHRNSKPPYDLEDRTLMFAKMIRAFVKNLQKTIGNIEDGKQVIKWVYAPYYMINWLKNRLIIIFSLTLYDKYIIYCHIWKQKVSQLQ